jgi:hypothetical protein
VGPVSRIVFSAEKDDGCVNSRRLLSEGTNSMSNMTQRSDRSVEQIERFLDTAATEVDELSLLTSEFLDDAGSGDASERDLLDVHCRMISTSTAIRDAAHTADVVDTERAAHHQIDDLLSAVAHTSRAMRRGPDAQQPPNASTTPSKIADAVESGLDAGLIQPGDARSLSEDIAAAADRYETE